MPTEQHPSPDKRSQGSLEPAAVDTAQLLALEPRAAIGLLIERYGDRLHALARRFCRQREEAEDLVQETFLQAFRHWETFRGESDPGTWLFTIASRLCARFHRKRSGEPGQLQSLEALAEQTFGQPQLADTRGEAAGAAMERAEERQKLEAAIEDLPDEFRLPLVLKETFGLPLEVIAEALGLELGTVKSRLYRARVRLAAALSESRPKRPVPPANFDRRVCLDLLEAKQAALDHGRSFEFPPGRFCERCAVVFSQLDFASDACATLWNDPLTAEARQRLLAALAG
jgi:RNA polymerase sigma-70 factor (ECF subfamily)